MPATDLNATTLITLCREVAGHLGPPWHLDTSTHPERDHPLTLSGPDGARIRLWYDDWTNAKRVEITGEYPDRIGHDQGIATHEITVARTREPRVIAREITRRLLPAYLPDLTRAQDIVRRRAHEKQAREHIAAQIAAVLPGTHLTEDAARGYPSRDLHLKLPGATSGSIRFSHDSQHANVTLDRVPTAVLPLMVAAITAPLHRPAHTPAADDPLPHT